MVRTNKPTGLFMKRYSHGSPHTSMNWDDLWTSARAFEHKVLKATATESGKTVIGAQAGGEYHARQGANYFSYSTSASSQANIIFPRLHIPIMAWLVDKRILAGGVAMLAVGIALSALFSSSMPAGQSGMTEEETLDLLIAQQELQDYSILSGILIAVGFMLVLISFGAIKRRRKGSKIQ